MYADQIEHAERVGCGGVGWGERARSNESEARETTVPNGAAAGVRLDAALTSSFPNLQEFHANGAGFEGPLPADLGGYRSLTVLDLSANAFRRATGLFLLLGLSTSRLHLPRITRGFQ